MSLERANTEVPNEVQRELSGDERVLWAGRPLPGVRLKASDALMIPFSLMWGGFAIFWEASVWSVGAPLFFRLWGVPFVLVGLYMIAGRFFFDAKVRERTVYALTDRRAIIASGLWYRSVRSIELRRLSELGFTESSGGIGTITFGPADPFGAFALGAGPPRVPKFELLAGARAVYEMARTLQQSK